MNLALEKIVALVIFLVVLVVLIIFTDLPRVFAGQINSQQEIRKCCGAYTGNSCPFFDIPTSRISNITAINCGKTLLYNLVVESNMSYTSLKIFCACP